MQSSIPSYARWCGSASRHRRLLIHSFASPVICDFFILTRRFRAQPPAQRPTNFVCSFWPTSASSSREPSVGRFTGALQNPSPSGLFEKSPKTPARYFFSSRAHTHRATTSWTPRAISSTRCSPFVSPTTATMRAQAMTSILAALSKSDGPLTTCTP